MRAFEFLTEYGIRKGIRYIKYRDGGKPPWYEKAVKLKTDNPHMSATEISRQVGVARTSIMLWLTGRPTNKGYIYNDNPPFTQKDFPNLSKTKYFDGEKPKWYEEAVAMRKQGMTWPAIADKLSTPEKRVSHQSIHNWLIKGRKIDYKGRLRNPDAPFEPRPQSKPINTDLIKELIVDKYTDEQIIELIADEKGDKIANQVRAMLPKLRQKLQPGTSVIDKTSTDDIDITFVKENFSD